MKTRIKELRQEKNYTQESLALKIGANQTTLSRIECGVAIPDADLLVKLSDAFQVSTDYILCLSDQRLTADSIFDNNNIHVQKYRSYLSLLQRLTPNQRIHLQHFLESMEAFY